MPAKPWTGKELAHAVAMLRTGATFERVGRELGRTTAQVIGAARRAGYNKGRDARAAARRRRVAKLNAKGYCPADIAKRCGCAREQVVRDLALAGLNPHTMTRQEAGRRVCGVIRHVHGKPIGFLRAERERIASVNEGWPPVSRRVAEYMGIIYDRGPLTVGQLAGAAGSHYDAAEAVLLKLRRGGRVTRVGRRGKFVLHDLTPAVREARDRVLAYRAARDLINCPRVSGEYTGGERPDPNPRRRRR